MSVSYIPDEDSEMPDHVLITTDSGTLDLTQNEARELRDSLNASIY